MCVYTLCVCQTYFHHYARTRIEKTNTLPFTFTYSSIHTITYYTYDVPIEALIMISFFNCITYFIIMLCASHFSSLSVSISLAIFHTPVCCAVLCTWYFQKFQSDNTIIINFWWVCVNMCVCTFLTHEEGECKCNKMWNRTGVKCEYVLRKTASRETSWTLLVCSAV